MKIKAQLSCFQGQKLVLLFVFQKLPVNDTKAKLCQRSIWRYTENFHENIVKYTITTVDFSCFSSQNIVSLIFVLFSSEEIESQES